MAKVFKHLDWVIKGNWLDVFEFWDLGLDIEWLETLPKMDIPSLNQYKYTKTKYACTIVWALVQASYLYDVDVTENDMLDCVEFAHTECNYQFWRWRFADLGMRALEKRFEKKRPNKKLYYSTIRRDDPVFYKLLKKWYPIGLTFGGNYQYSKDYQTDCILNWNNFWTATYRHRTTMVYRDWKVYIMDSAWGNSYNVYEIKDLPWLFQNWVYDPTLFVFTQEANILDTKELSRLVQMRNTANVINYNANKQIVLTTDELYKNDLREIIYKNIDKVAQIDQMIKKWETWII